MKIVAKPIKTIVVFEYDDKPPIPYKFKIMEESGEEITVKVDKRLNTHRSRIAGSECIIYECQSIINGIDRRYELKYIVPKCQWQLYKI